MSICAALILALAATPRSPASARLGDDPPPVFAALSFDDTLARTVDTTNGPQSEKELLSEFNKSFTGQDPAKRAEAITVLGDLARQLADQGISKAVAKALVKGLEDDDLDVRNAAVTQLAFGRDVDTAIAGFEELLKDLRKELDDRLELTDKDSRDFVARGTVVFQNGCHALATYRDDRTASILANLLSGVRANDLGNRLIGALAVSALSLGTLDTVTAAVRQTHAFKCPPREPSAHPLYAALIEFASKIGAPPPEWSESYSSAWDTWFQANQAKFPKKLGRLKMPPMEGPAHALDGLPGKSG